MGDIPRITGVEKVLEVLGDWPVFHDAELLSFRLDCSAADDFADGPTIEARILQPDYTGVAQSDGPYGPRRYFLIALRFRRVMELKLSGFGAQNRLHALSIRDVRDWQREGIRWRVILDSLLELEGSFLCSEAEVVRIMACDQSGLPIESES